MPRVIELRSLTSDEAEHRRTRRIRCSLPVVMYSGTNIYSCTAVDLSAVGCRLQSDESLVFVPEVTLVFSKSATFIWRRGRFSGWRFDYQKAERLQTTPYLVR